MGKDLLTILMVVAVSLGLAIAAPGNSVAAETQFRRIAVKDYIDKMKAGWVGQMVGVGWGGPTEFRFKGQIIPEVNMPKWRPGLVNQFEQDDIYVEMTFLRTLEQYGLNVSIRQAGVSRKMQAAKKFSLFRSPRRSQPNSSSAGSPAQSAVMISLIYFLFLLDSGWHLTSNGAKVNWLKYYTARV